MTNTSPKKKTLKVKDLSNKFRMSVKDILHSLAQEGIDLLPTDTIPSDLIELVEDHLTQVNDLLLGDKKSSNKESSGLREIHIKTPIVVKSLAEALGKKTNEVIQALIAFNELAGPNQPLEVDLAIKVADKLGFSLQVDRREKSDHVIEKEVEPSSLEDLLTAIPDDADHLVIRPPVVTFLGHVDHGKTSLQDKARKTHVTSGEAGGITQHIGASTIHFNGKPITFIDTPGHEAFTAMRARGANVTDIAILVVAADDGFMPQTIEALSHAKAAKVPIIVAANKIDLPQADTDKVLRQMQENGLFPEPWGGEVAMIPCSAHTGQGINELLERVLLEAEMLDLKADPTRIAQGVVIEAQLETGLGPTVNLLVQRGTLNVGDPILSGEFAGKVRGMVDDKGHRVKSAGPSTPVKVIGLSGVPSAGQQLYACRNEKEAKEAAEQYAYIKREDTLSRVRGTTLEELFNANEVSKNSLQIVLKTDVRGSAEAIADSLGKLPSEKIAVNIVHSGVGAITENDVILAAASNAIVVGFHVRVNPGVNATAKQHGSEIRLYSIIYQLIEDIKDAMEGKLDPEKREIQMGTGKILKIIELSKGPPVVGTLVETGSVRVGMHVRVFRKKELIFNGEVRSLRRFQDDVKEVKQGLECGIRLDNFKDLEEGDILQFYEVKLEKSRLS